jgi:cystine transport system substrate-binding protein
VYAPYSFHDESGKLVGYDVEVAEQVAKKLGVKAGFCGDEMGRHDRRSGCGPL